MGSCEIHRMVVAVSLVLWLAACSTTWPLSEQQPVAEAPAQVGKSSPADSPPQVGSSTRTDVAVLDPDDDVNAQSRHRQALVKASSDSLETDEVGYYMDILEARLIQQVRDDRVNIKREGNTFTLLIAGSDAFDSNQSQLKPGVLDVLASITAVLEEYRDTQISIYGHTDDIGENEYNQKLSERRAQSVAGFLIEGGIAAKRIVIIGYGESRPRVANSSAEGRGHNRRIELLVVPLAKGVP